MSALLDEVRRRRRIPTPAVARAIRLAAGVSQARIASEVGVHPVTVARWESGARRPSGEVGQRYLQLLDELQREVAS